MSPREKPTPGPSPLRTVMNMSSLSPSRTYQDSDTDADTDPSSSADEDEDEVELAGGLESSPQKAEPVHWERRMTRGLAKYSWLREAEAAVEAERGKGGKAYNERMRKEDADVGGMQRMEDEGEVREMSKSRGSNGKGKRRVSWWDGSFEDEEGTARERTGDGLEPGGVQGSGNRSDTAKLRTNSHHSGAATWSHLKPDARPSVLGRRKRRDDEDAKDSSRPSTEKKLRSGRLL